VGQDPKVHRPKFIDSKVHSINHMIRCYLARVRVVRVPGATRTTHFHIIINIVDIAEIANTSSHVES